jgi:hypothetical protein
MSKNSKEQGREEKSSGWLRIAEKLVIPIIVVIIGAIVGPIIVTRCTSPTVVESFTYQVQVQDQNTGEAIKGANVTITIGGDIAPVDDVSDTKGFAMIDIDSSRAGKRGRLIVTAPGYDRYEKSITLVEDALPNIVQLAPSP